MKKSFLILILAAVGVGEALAEPSLNSIGPADGNQARLDFSRSIDEPPYQVQYSPDLRHWFPMGVTIPENGSIFFELPSAKQMFYRMGEFAKREVPVLVILVDFQDTSFPANVVTPADGPEKSWSDLLFGSNFSQGNHYWNEVSQGRFQTRPAFEAQAVGLVADGVFKADVLHDSPTTGSYRIQDQPWIYDALDLAAQQLDFEAFDVDANGSLSNDELSILFVMNLTFSRISGAAAEANISIDHTVDGVAVEKISRTLADYSSIGVNMHELGHHMFELDHGLDGRDSTLMGTGAYNEDETVSKFTKSWDHWGTRPAHPSADSKIRAGFVSPMTLSSSMTNIPLYSAVSPHYNVVKIPSIEGYILLENRTKEGYDLALPFADGHAGGMVATRVNDFRRIIRKDIDEYSNEFKDTYLLDGYEDELLVGGYRIYNVSGAGPKMTFDLEKLPYVEPAVEDYRVRYWITDPDRVGYRLWQIDDPSVVNTVDFTTLSGADTPLNRIFTFNLDGRFNTGEVLPLNAQTGWSSDNAYVMVSQSFSNPSKTEAIVRVVIDEMQPYVGSANISVQYGAYSHSFELQNLPNLN